MQLQAEVDEAAKNEEDDSGHDEQVAANSGAAGEDGAAE